MMTPTRLNNRYQVIRDIGAGGFGQTFLVEDTQMPTQRRCVAKQLKPVTTNPQIFQLLQDRFAREAAILEELGEGNTQIPRLYAYFEEDGQFYLVQEWIEGETLTNRVEKGGKLSESTVREILVSLLRVLEFVHSQRIVHRDIKPDNIILRNSDGTPVLIDFGAVKETMGTVMNSSGNGTRSIVIGTPGFMPSEQAAGRPVYSSDLYSLGLTAIYLLTEKWPQELQTNHDTGEIVWRQYAPRISPSLATVLDKAIMSHPRDRFHTAREMLDALEARNSSSPAVAVAPVPPTVASVPPVAYGVPVTTVSAPPPNNQPPTVVSPPTSQPVDTTRSSGMGDWQKAMIIGGIIGTFVLFGLWITRPQPTPTNATASSETENSGSSPTPETSSNFAPVPSQSTPSTPSITSQEAVGLINNWLYAKDRMFAPPYSRQLAAELTTGVLYADLIKPDGPIAWLENNNAYYQYGVRKVESVERFSADGDRASLEVFVTEDRTLYKNGRADPEQSKFSTDKVRYTLQLVNGTWKIADYQ
ncbi:protein kinase domain-containing protein [Laspinema olomoucense]|uniref:non-specific serine/threonine protein kinase n=1 Tax=Laspinema olomoucense D3b TaxID=2953688 RepID=A0ABT2NFF3_9CYAN|nr:IMS domain-containing protein [Laspinema sp. D3b]MCT7981226.1 IMS domain-containing protein [Laspinema sp. D3b]